MEIKRFYQIHVIQEGSLSGFKALIQDGLDLKLETTLKHLKASLNRQI